ncbi:hypothetical protein Scep_006122 [Stephania cephalantha]|uniref:Uncharacterized protein n=1 Tax=Stephania cephalantha TaxID=152367 RepID=A0AAP0K8M2_9MAGN
MFLNNEKCNLEQLNNVLINESFFNALLILCFESYTIHFVTATSSHALSF